MNRLFGLESASSAAATAAPSIKIGAKFIASRLQVSLASVTTTLEAIFRSSIHSLPTRRTNEPICAENLH